MSVIDDLKGLDDLVAQRMQELRPLVDEYRELEQVAQRLGVSPPAADSAPARATGTTRTTRARRSARRARPKATSAATPATTATANGPAATAGVNGRREQLLEMVKARPGITVREVGSELGVDPTSLYRIVHRLEKDGALKKRGRELVPS